MQVLREADYRAVPWKNGGGITREILRFPAEPAPFDWRLSLASIDIAGPFSSFDGHERTLLLVRGAGVTLNFGQHGKVRLATAGESVTFDGAWQTDCTLLDGPSTDLNLIVARSRAETQAHSVAVSDSLSIPTDGWAETLVCCVSGELTLTNSAGAAVRLQAVDVARCHASDGELTCRRVSEAPLQVFWAGLRLRDGRR